MMSTPPAYWGILLALVITSTEANSNQSFTSVRAPQNPFRFIRVLQLLSGWSMSNHVRVDGHEVACRALTVVKSPSHTSTHHPPAQPLV